MTNVTMCKKQVPNNPNHENEQPLKAIVIISVLNKISLLSYFKTQCTFISIKFSIF